MNSTSSDITATAPLKLVEFQSNHLRVHEIDNWPIKTLTCATHWCDAECSVCKTKTSQRREQHFSQEGVIMCNNKDCSNFGKPVCDNNLPMSWNDEIKPEENLKLGVYHNFQKLANVKYLCPKSVNHTIDFIDNYRVYCRECDDVMTYCSNTYACKKVFSLGTLRSYSGSMSMLYEECSECTDERAEKAKSKKRKAEDEENTPNKRQSDEEL